MRKDWCIEKTSLSTKDYTQPHTLCVRAVVPRSSFPSLLLAPGKSSVSTEKLSSQTSVLVEVHPAFRCFLPCLICLFLCQRMFTLYICTRSRQMDCVGHVQKRMGTALRNLKTQYRGQKLADGKTIGGAGRLTDKVIDSLQNYYGDAIRRNKGDVQAMMKAVQASLLHSNSTNVRPRHHLCPVGPDSWCKWQVAQATGTVYDHKDPLPDAMSSYYALYIHAWAADPYWRSVCRAILRM